MKKDFKNKILQNKVKNNKTMKEEKKKNYIVLII